MRVIVTGGRDYTKWAKVAEVLGGLEEIKCIVHGTLRGADRLCVEWAHSKGIPTEEHPTDVDSYGRRATYIRNLEMVELGADLMVAFPGRSSTRILLQLAEDFGIPVVEVTE